MPQPPISGSYHLSEHGPGDLRPAIRHALAANAIDSARARVFVISQSGTLAHWLPHVDTLREALGSRHAGTWTRIWRPHRASTWSRPHSRHAPPIRPAGHAGRRIGDRCGQDDRHVPGQRHRHARAARSAARDHGRRWHHPPPAHAIGQRARSRFHHPVGKLNSVRSQAVPTPRPPMADHRARNRTPPTP